MKAGAVTAPQSICVNGAMHVANQNDNVGIMIVCPTLP
jgi:hypothetical protein